MIRKFNYTGRVKIKQSSVNVNVTDIGTTDACFDCSVNLDEYEFPDHGKVFLEAYRGSYVRRRFFLGDVGSTETLDEEEIPEFANFPAFNFMVLVVDTIESGKRILGRSSPLFFPTDSHGVGRNSILPVKYVQNMSQIWNVDFESGRPVLALNRDLRNVEQLITKDRLFRHSVFPAVLREILLHYYIIPAISEEDENVSLNEWSEFIRETLEMANEMEILLETDELDEEHDPLEKFDAIERIVDKFTQFNFPKLVSNEGVE